jgi:HEAT repeat protein
MRKKILILWAVLLVGLVGTFFWQRSNSRDRIFRGKPESDWIQHLSYSDEEQVKQWRQFGPDGVRVLLRALDKANHPFERAYRKAYRRMLPVFGRLLPAPRMDSSLALRMTVVDLLSRLSKDARIATPAMVRELQDENTSVRQIAINFFTGGEDQNALLNQMEKDEKRSLFPIFLAGMQDANPGVRNNSAVALRYYPEQAQVVVPALVKASQDSNSSVCHAAAWSLEQLRSAGSPKADLK